MQLYYFSQRKNLPIWYAALRDPVSGNVGTKKSTGPSVRREAETVAQLWLRDGMPRTSKESYETFVDYLDHFWDFDNSRHFKEMLTMGKNVTRRVNEWVSLKAICSQVSPSRNRTGAWYFWNTA